jgi:hypothetical protein
MKSRYIDNYNESTLIFRLMKLSYHVQCHRLDGWPPGTVFNSVKPESCNCCLKKDALSHDTDLVSVRQTGLK